MYMPFPLILNHHVKFGLFFFSSFRFHFSAAFGRHHVRPTGKESHMHAHSIQQAFVSDF